MSDIMTNAKAQSEQKQKKLVFLIPSLLIVCYMILKGIAEVLSIVGDIEIVKRAFAYGATGAMRSYCIAGVVEDALDLICCFCAIILYDVCIEKAFGKKQKAKAKSFFIMSICFQIVNFVIFFIREILMNIDSLSLFAVEAMTFSFIAILPFIVWYGLLLLSEIKQNKKIRIITIVIGGIYTAISAVATLGNLVIFLSMEESPLLPYENKTQLFSSIGSTLLYLSITLYQLLGFKKKEKPQQYVVQPQYAQPVYQPIYQPQPTYQPPQPVAPAPINQPSTEERLATIQKLFDDNVITQEEYDKKRAEILSGI